MTTSPLLDIVHPQVSRYISSLSTETDPHVIRMAVHAKELDVPRVDLSAGRWIELLTRSVAGRRVFEFGSAFGFSTYFLARAVGPEGEVHGSEINEERVSRHEVLFANHPYRDRITLHRGDGVEVLNQLPGLFDVIFIDMKKQLYPAALQAAVPRVRVGGLILADNVLWSGRTAVVPDEPKDERTASLREFNRMIFEDERLRTEIMPASDGISVSIRLS